MPDKFTRHLYVASVHVFDQIEDGADRIADRIGLKLVFDDSPRDNPREL